MQAAMQQLTIGAMDSQQGGLHEAPGSQVGLAGSRQQHRMRPVAGASGRHCCSAHIAGQLLLLCA
jgi:hypothetical protein